MERRKLLNGQFSLSTSNLSSTTLGPSAESTKISNLYSNYSLNKGDLSLSSGKLSNSITTNNTNRITHVSKNKSLAQKIDPRIYTDINSKGLTSRIVKYYDNPTKMNRSMSATNLYNKPGQFPIVHLKKLELPYVASRNQRSVSMVRIAPPEKSIFQANTRASILRSASIVPNAVLKKSDDEISRENRPILHPAVEIEVAPTRSVLDDLKEISRKRINSDELDSNDSMKKSCKESGNYTLPATTGSIPQTNHIQTTTQCFENVPSKRQRENPISPTNTGYIASEQHHIKRRMYTTSSSYNNDISSSLSSSLSILTPKRKLNRIHSSSPEENSTNDQTQIVRTSKQRNPKQLCRDNNNYDSFETHINNNNSLAQKKLLSNSVSTLNSSEFIADGVSLKTGTENTTLSSTSNIENAVVPQKPRITLFNKNYDETITKTMKSKCNKNLRDDLCHINFVTPQPSEEDTANNSLLGLNKSFLIEKTQKSKLALMLSGLRGDLDTESIDEVDFETPSENNELVEITDKMSYDNIPALNAIKPQTNLDFGTTTTVETKTITSPTTTIKSNILQNSSISDKTSSESTETPNKIGAGFFGLSSNIPSGNLNVTNTVDLLVDKPDINLPQTLPVSKSSFSMARDNAFNIGGAVSPPVTNFGLPSDNQKSNLPTIISNIVIPKPSTLNFPSKIINTENQTTVEKQNPVENKTILSEKQLAFGDMSKLNNNNNNIEFVKDSYRSDKPITFGEKFTVPNIIEQLVDADEKSNIETKKFTTFGTPEQSKSITTNNQIVIGKDSKVNTKQISFGDISNAANNNQIDMNINNKVQNKQFTFGENSMATNTPQFNLTQNSTLSNKLFSFSSNPTMENNSTQQFGIQSASTHKPFSFSGAAATTTASSEVSTNLFGKDSNANIGKESPFNLEKKDSVIDNNATFNFGSSTNEADKKSADQPLPTFKFNTTNSSPPKFTAPDSIKLTGVSAFASAFPKSNTSFNEMSTTFSVNNSTNNNNNVLDSKVTVANTTVNAPNGLAQSNVFSFSSEKPVTTNNIFGNPADCSIPSSTFQKSDMSFNKIASTQSNTNTFLFGDSKNTETTEATKSIFGAKTNLADANKTISTFTGNSTSATETGNTSATFASPFSFKSTTNNDNGSGAAVFPFNANSTATNKPIANNIFGNTSSAANNSFTFGSNTKPTTDSENEISSSSTFAVNKTPSFSFSSGNTQSSGNGFTFGQVSNSNENKTAIAFDATTNETNLNKSSTFQFGSSTLNNPEKASNSFSFSANKTISSAGDSHSLTFGGAASMNSNQVTNPVATNNNVFAFGGNSTLNNPNPFEGACGDNNSKPPPFSFGAANNNQNNTNLFNSGATNSVATPNLFAPPAANTQAPGERVIRKATRRLHK